MTEGLKKREIFAKITRLPKKKLYISSTYKDLSLYRERVANTVRDLHPYFEVVRIMEHMGTGSDKPILEEIMDDVDECDIYVLLIGKLYGSIEENTRLSYTENEFDRAVEKKKHIIALMADPQAEGLKDIAIDDLSEYQRFVSKVGTRRLVDAFQTVDHMTTRLVLALFRLSDKKWPIDDVKILCDRDTQVSDFRSARIRNQQNVFAFFARRSDQANYLVQRLALIMLGLSGYHIPHVRPASMISGSGVGYRKFEQRMITLILSRLGGDEFTNDHTTMEKMFGFLNDKKVPHFLIEMLLEPEDFDDNELLLDHLRNFLIRMEQYNRAVNMTLYFIIIIQTNEEEHFDELLLDHLDCPSDSPCIYSIKRLDPLSRIKRTEVQDWLEEHITIHGYLIIDEILNDYFPTRKHRISMSELYPEMGKIIEKINEKIQD